MRSFVAAAIAIVCIAIATPARAEAPCVYPVTTVNDDLDDRDAILTARDLAQTTGGRLCLAAGQYDIYRWSVGAGCTNPNVELREQGVCGRSSFGAIPVRGVELEIAGAGDKTVIAYRGEWPQDGALIDVVQGGSAYIHDLRLDASQATVRNEQLHLLSGGDRGARNVSIERVTFYNPPTGIPGMRIGDSIHLIAPLETLPGGAVIEHWIENVSIHNSRAEHAGRAFLYTNYGARRIVMDGVFCGAATDQCVDGEVSSTVRSPAVTDIIIVNSVMTTGNGQGGTIGLGGTGLQTRIVIANNVLTDGGVLVGKAGRVTITGNVIGGFVEAVKQVEGLVVTGNDIENYTGHAAVSATCRDSGCPAGVVVSGNRIVQRGAARALSFSGIDRLTVDGNQIEYLGSTPRAAIGFEYATVANVPQTMRNVVITDNLVRGNTSFLLSAQAETVGIILDGNVSESGQGAWFQAGVTSCLAGPSLMPAATWFTSGPVSGSPSGCV